MSALNHTADTLNQLVLFLTEERKQGDQAIKDILLSNHPLFAALRKALSIPYPIIFRSIDEMNALFAARKTQEVDPADWDDKNYMEYLSKWTKKDRLLKICRELFDDSGALKPMTPDAWNDDFVSISDIENKQDDDLPF